ncbi:MAG: isocitrate lyase [Flavobacteriales bacterium]|nr:MAG: isocitrate lyase [Flavobacteriales bacterium]
MDKLDNKRIKEEWRDNERWEGIIRPYDSEDVLSLRPSILVEHTLAKYGAKKMWNALKKSKCLTALGALTGNQAIQQVQAGLRAIYLSGWQVAADANLGGKMFPDQSLYPANSVPNVVKRINNALLSADQINKTDPENNVDWLVPIIADAEAGFGGNLNAFELMKLMIEAGASAVHFEDQLSSAKKCGHMGGKVLVPTQEAINKLVAARLATDVLGTETLIIARTDADSAGLITSNIDDRDKPFIVGDRSSEGFYKVKAGIDQAINRGLSYAPYADLIWCETSKPNIEEARKFAKAIHAIFPGKLLAYNCSPSFNWQANLSEEEMRTFREELNELGFKFQFITLAGFHVLNTSMFELAKKYVKDGMAGYSKLQVKEFEMQKDGFKAVKHQEFVGVNYYDKVQEIITSGKTSTKAMEGSTEEEQFHYSKAS